MSETVNVEQLLAAMKTLGASDLHLKAGMPPVYRVGGHLRSASSMPPMTGAAIDRCISPIIPPGRRGQAAGWHGQALRATEYGALNACPICQSFRLNSVGLCRRESFGFFRDRFFVATAMMCPPDKIEFEWSQAGRSFCVKRASPASPARGLFDSKKLMASKSPYPTMQK